MNRNRLIISLNRIAFALIFLLLVSGVFWFSHYVPPLLEVQQLPADFSPSNDLTSSLDVLSPETVFGIQEIADLSVPGNEGSVLTMIQTPNMLHLLSLYSNGIVRRWDLFSQKIISENDVEYAHRDAGNFSANGSLLITPVNFDSEKLYGYSVWNTLTWEQLDCFGAYHPNAFDYEADAHMGVIIDPKGELIIEVQPKIISFNGCPNRPLEESGAKYGAADWIIRDWLEPEISRVAIDPSGTYIAYALEDGKITISEYDEVSKMGGSRPFKEKHVKYDSEETPLKINYLVFDNTVTWLASLTGNELTVWDLRKLLFPLHMEKPISDGNIVAFDRTGRILVVGSDSGFNIFDLEKETQIVKYEVGEVTALYFSRDNRLLIWGDVNGDIHLWGVPRE